MKPTAMGCFVYAGGFTQGVKARFSVKHHLENKRPYGQWEAEHNHNVEVHPYGWWTDSLPSVDVVYANPPCAPFSSAGYTAGTTHAKWEEDERMLDHAAAIAMGSTLGASVVVIESVQAAWTRGRAWYEREMQRSLGPKWKVSCLLHDASWLGLPQRRRRAFIVFHQQELDPLRCDADATVLTPRTWQRLPRGQDSKRPAGGRVSLQTCIEHTLPGEKMKRGWERAGCPAGAVPSQVSSRLEWGKPAPTMAGTYGYAHPDEQRFISLAEYSRLCGFPDDYAFRPGTSANNQVLLTTRGVMPPVAARLAETLRGTLQERPVRNT